MLEVPTQTSHDHCEHLVHICPHYQPVQWLSYKNNKYCYEVAMLVCSDSNIFNSLKTVVFIMMTTPLVVGECMYGHVFIKLCISKTYFIQWLECTIHHIYFIITLNTIRWLGCTIHHIYCITLIQYHDLDVPFTMFILL